MMDFAFTRHDLIGFLLRSGAWLTAGTLIGGFHLVTLQWSVRKLVAGRPILLPVGVQFARFALIASILTAIASSFGAFSLLLTTAGIVVVRTVIVQWCAQS